MTPRLDDGWESAMGRWLRGTDPLPGSEALANELDVALPRTRAALGTVGAVGTVRTVAAVVAAYIREPAPWGVVHVAASAHGIVAIELVSDTDEFAAGLSRRLGGAVVPDAPGLPAAIRGALAAARVELEEYFAGGRTAFDLVIDLHGVSDWDRLVLDGARRLAYGEVTSYGALARAIGRPRAARAVGGALGRNPVPVVIPCHRILAANGTLGGYGGGGHAPHEVMLDVKRWLLALEGAPVAGA
jgi:methylated-DNA-[protein]-cysteine S-methyltransferase